MTNETEMWLHGDTNKWGYKRLIAQKPKKRGAKVKQRQDMDFYSYQGTEGHCYIGLEIKNQKCVNNSGYGESETSKCKTIWADLFRNMKLIRS